jgi:hypothetical protein
MAAGHFLVTSSVLVAIIPPLRRCLSLRKEAAMSNPLLAKIGVFALIVVNLGAYYVFWPRATPHAPTDIGNLMPMEKQDSPGKPLSFASSASAAQPAEPAKPSLIPGDVLPGVIPPLEPLGKKPALLPDPLIGGAAPVTNGLPAIPTPSDSGPLPSPVRTLIPVKAEDPTIAQLKRLKESFGKESGSQAAPPPLTVLAKESPNLKPVPAKVENTPMQAANSPWSLQMEIAGGQKVLNARLNKRSDFRIVCDHLEMKTLDGAVVAMGKVTFTGPGLQGSCNRLTLGLIGDSLVLDGKAEVRVQQGGSSDPVAELKGQQLMLRLQQPAAGLTPVQPLTVTPAAPPPVEASPFSILSSQRDPSPIGGSGLSRNGTGR